jgi:hypothetical protein
MHHIWLRSRLKAATDSHSSPPKHNCFCIQMLYHTQPMILTRIIGCTDSAAHVSEVHIRNHRNANIKLFCIFAKNRNSRFITEIQGFLRCFYGKFKVLCFWGSSRFWSDFHVSGAIWNYDACISCLLFGLDRLHWGLTGVSWHIFPFFYREDSLATACSTTGFHIGGIQRCVERSRYSTTSFRPAASS